MKNPFEKENHTVLFAAIAIAGLAAGAIAFLYLTEKGNNARKGLKKKIKGIAKDATVNAISKKTRIKKKVVKTAADEVLSCNGKLGFPQDPKRTMTYAVVDKPFSH